MQRDASSGSGHRNDPNEVVQPQPKLKIRLSGLGSGSLKGKEREHQLAGPSISEGRERLEQALSGSVTPATSATLTTINGLSKAPEQTRPSGTRTGSESDIQLEPNALLDRRKGQEAEAEEERTKIRQQEELVRNVQELPPIARQHLVPVTEITRRAVARSFNELQSLVEVLPSKSDVDRKRSIVEYVISTRRQIIKLLVLLRWAKDNTEDTERAINLIAFLQRQNFQLERAVESLKGVSNLLAGARVRNYDLATAIDVLSSGSYTRLPGVFKETFLEPPRLTALEVLNLLQDLEAVIRYRLQMHEQLPFELSQKSYRIHDGRVTFTCPRLFKASFTLGGDSMTDQWYLVDITFDFQGRDIPPKPSQGMRDHILQVVNDILAKYASDNAMGLEPQVSGPSHVEGADAMSTGVEALPIPSYSRSGQALIKASSLLQRLCLNYQLEMMHYHAVQVNSMPTIWQGRLSISLTKNRASLEIKYSKPAPTVLPANNNQSRKNQPMLHFDERINFSISQDAAVSPSVDQPKDFQSQRRAHTHAVSSHLLAIAGKLSEAGSTRSIQPKTASSDIRALTGSGDPSTVQGPSSLSCLFTRDPYYLDKQGRRVQPLPHIVKTFPSRQERAVSLWEPHALSRLRDLEGILAECFTATS